MADQARDDEADDPEAAANRLEAALERIAALSADKTSAQSRPNQSLPDQPQSPMVDADLSIPEIAERLDSLIARLRAALGTTPTDEANTD